MPEVYLLDTTIVINLSRWKDVGKIIDYQFKLSQSADNFISVITAGEILSLVLQWDWSQSQINVVKQLLGQLRGATISHPSILNAYAEINKINKQFKKTMGQNDVWIAATARAMNVPLLTMDKDFTHLCPSYITRILIDRNTGAVL